MDLVLIFDKQQVVQNLGMVDDGDCVVLRLTGKLKDGRTLIGEDVVKILKKGKKKS